MNNIEISLDKKLASFQLASSWKELKPQQFRAIAPSILTGNIYYRNVLTVLSASKVIDKLPPEGLQHLYDCIDWLLSDPCTFPPLEYIKIKHKKYFLPGEKLMNISVIEFAFLDMCHVLYQFFLQKQQTDKAQEWLTKLCMYMCRPIDKRIDPKDPTTYKGDRREQFNTTIIESRYELFKTIALEEQFACLLFFVGCKKYIHERYRNQIFFQPFDEDGNEVIGVKRNDKPQPLQWIEITRKMAGGKFGNLEQTRFTPLYDILEELKERKPA